MLPEAPRQRPRLDTLGSLAGVTPEPPFHTRQVRLRRSPTASACRSLMGPRVAGMAIVWCGFVLLAHIAGGAISCSMDTSGCAATRHKITVF